MEPFTITILVLVGLLVLLAAGMPIAAALGLVAITGLFLLKGAAGLVGVPNVVYSQIDNFVLVAVPLFIFMGEALFITGLGGELFTAASRWLGRLPGGLAMSSVVACAVFDAMCGVSVAGAATIGVMAIPEMTSRGYNRVLATGSVAAAGALAILIPPSVPLILYGNVAEESVGALFMGGVIPGLVLSLLMMAYIGLLVLSRPHLAPPIAIRYSWKERLSSLWRVWPAAVLILLVMGAIYTGIATPTEAAGVGAAGSLLLAGLVYRALNWQNFRRIVMTTARTSGMVLLIVACAMLFGYLLTLLQVPQQLTAFAVGLPVSRWVVMILINLLLMVMGCFLDVASVILISAPILLPIVSALGFDLVWFGIILTINMEMAVITPPVGLNLYVIKGIAKDVPLADILKGALPFVVVEAIAIALVMVFPQLALWLPSKML